MRTHDDEVIAALRARGLSNSGFLGSTGTQQHAARLARGTVTAATLARYADDLARITDAASTAIPSDFWDVQSPLMQADGLTEYTTVGTLARPEYADYLRLLGQAFARFHRFQQDSVADTALATACDLLRLSTAAVQAGISTPVFAGVPHFTAEARALFLWQQIACGTTRWLPVVQRPLFPHSVWSRCNVATMWQYAILQGMTKDAAWGVSGLHPDYVGAPHNANQIEHLTITTVLQTAYHTPTPLLNLVEVAEAALTPSIPIAERDADIALNRVIAREFVPRFTLGNAEAAIDHLQTILATPALRWLPPARVPTTAIFLTGGLVGAGAVAWVAWRRSWPTTPLPR